MNTKPVKKFIRVDSLEEFVFVDHEGILNVDFSDSPVKGVSDIAGLDSVISTLTSVVEKQGFVISVPRTALAATAVGALTGSVLGGPSGLAIGLITGAVLGYRTSRKQTTITPQQEKCSVRQIFNQMSLRQKKELLQELLGCLKHSNVRSLMLEIVKNENIRSVALDIVFGFLKKKMGVSLTRQK